MSRNKITRKLKIGREVWRKQGFLGFIITSLQFVQKKLRGKSSTHSLSPIYTHVKYEDALTANPTTTPPAWPGTDRKSLRFNWVMPPPGKGSGGHYNIFRFINYLEKSGHDCRIYLYSIHEGAEISAIKAVMGDSYPLLKAHMKWLRDGEDMEEADGIFATSWESAYPVYNSRLSAKRFYFVQDFEPYFYPPGSLYALAENTYKFGFYGITAGGWLSVKLKRDYGMQTDNYDFGSDSNLYTFSNNGHRREIFFYARPYTERRGFELGIMALDLFHRKHPEYTINLAGWDVSEYKIPFPYKNLSTLEIKELNELYNKCAAALVLSFTNMSLLPLELLSSGAIPIVNEGENNLLVSSNPYISYSPSNPVALAERLSEAVTRPDLPRYAKEASASVKQNTWDEAGKKFVRIVERETRRHE